MPLFAHVARKRMKNSTAASDEATVDPPVYPDPPTSSSVHPGYEADAAADVDAERRPSLIGSGVSLTVLRGSLPTGADLSRTFADVREELERIYEEEEQREEGNLAPV